MKDMKGGVAIRAGRVPSTSVKEGTFLFLFTSDEATVLIILKARKKVMSNVKCSHLCTVH